MFGKKGQQAPRKLSTINSNNIIDIEKICGDKVYTLVGCAAVAGNRLKEQEKLLFM
jgi:hypothetical protein